MRRAQKLRTKISLRAGPFDRHEQTQTVVIFRMRRDDEQNESYVVNAYDNANRRVFLFVSFLHSKQDKLANDDKVFVSWTDDEQLRPQARR